MHDQSKTNQDLLKEISTLKQIIRKLEISEAALKLVNDGLRESEEKYKMLHSDLPDLTFSLSPEGQYIYVNRAFADRAGKTVEDITGKRIWDVLSKKEADNHFAAVSQVFRTGKQKVIEVRVPQEDSNRYYIMTITPIKDSKGEILSLLCSAKDITDRKQAEEKRRKLEKKLQHAHKMDAIGTFARDIANDFNNLLMGIQGIAALSLLDFEPLHPHYERLRQIEEQVQIGVTLTNQMLQLTREHKYEMKPTEMNDIIQKTSSVFGKTKKKVSIRRKTAKDLWIVRVAREQIEHVFQNLYVNACQSMTGGGVIYLETENVLLNDEQALSYAVKPGKYVKITVTDTGAGIDEKTKGRIFDPFFTTKRMGRGTGLGLATVYGIIKSHDGIINVHSEPGQGTTFTIYLPAIDESMLKEKIEKGPEIIAMGTETILLVDDDEQIRKVYNEMLESMGYHVYMAVSGQEAIAIYTEKKNEIAVVILDINMPGMSGGETFDRLKEINSNIKVLLSSGYDIDGQIQEILDRGCKGFLQKPFRFSQFSIKMREILE